VLVAVKKYYKKEEPEKLSGLGLKFLDFTQDQMNPKTVLASMWLYDQTRWSVYLRHKDIYDNVGQPDERGYADTKTQHPVVLTYHFKEGTSYKDVDEVEFINIKPEQGKLKDFSDDEIKTLKDKAIEEVKAETENKLNKHTEYFTNKAKQDFKFQKQPDWDKIAEGKVRHGIAVAFIESGAKLTEETKSEINSWVKFVMG
jgi:hypothetical protein